MNNVPQDDFSQQQWSVLEKHYHTKKPIVGRIIEIQEKYVTVNVNGINGIVDDFVFAYTKQIEENVEPEDISVMVQQAMKGMVGKDIIVRICGIDKNKQYVKLSQRLFEQRTDVQVGQVYTGVFTAFGPHLVSLDVEGNNGKLLYQGSYMHSPEVMNELVKRFQFGQELQVVVEQKKNREHLLVSVFNDGSM